MLSHLKIVMVTYWICHIRYGDKGIQGYLRLILRFSTHHNSDGGVHLPCVDRTHGRAFCGFPNEVEFFVEPLMDSLDLVWKPWPPLRTVSNTSIPHQQAPFRTPFPMDLNEFTAPFPAVSCKWISVGFLMDFCCPRPVSQFLFPSIGMDF